MNKDGENKERKQNEKEKQQIQVLRSGNTGAIVETIEEIRNTGRISILPEIFELMLITQVDEIYSACKRLLNDLKNDEAREAMIIAIRTERYMPILSDLAASCWQSGMDYSEYITDFIPAFFSGTYETAIEVFTVIEENIAQVDKKKQLEIISILKERMKEAGEKSALLHELIRVISSLPETE